MVVWLWLSKIWPMNVRFWRFDTLTATMNSWVFIFLGSNHVTKMIQIIHNPDCLTTESQVVDGLKHNQTLYPATAAQNKIL